MKGADRSIIIGVSLVGLMAAFWFLILSPKRDRSTELEQQAVTLQESVSNYEALAAAAEDAEANFDENYRSLVVLGKAVPSDSDTSSLFVQLNQLAADAKVNLASIELKEGTGGAPAPPPPAAETTADQAEPPTSEGGGSSVPVEAAATPTETTAATLPLGATVGPAGLPVMPYYLTLDGSFFELADFLKGIDDLVGYAGAKPSVHGRLLTIDGFSLKNPTASLAPNDATAISDALVGELAVTSYVSPAEQGTMAGATPAGPAPPVSTPVSSTTPPAPTAAVTP